MTLINSCYYFVKYKYKRCLHNWLISQNLNQTSQFQNFCQLQFLLFGLKCLQLQQLNNLKLDYFLCLLQLEHKFFDRIHLGLCKYLLQYIEAVQVFFQ